MCESVLGCKVDAGDDRTVRAAAVLVEDFDTVEACALGDTKVRATNRTSTVGTVWKEWEKSLLAWMDIGRKTGVFKKI